MFLSIPGNSLTSPEVQFTGTTTGNDLTLRVPQTMPQSDLHVHVQQTYQCIICRQWLVDIVLAVSVRFSLGSQTGKDY